MLHFSTLDNLKAVDTSAESIWHLIVPIKVRSCLTCRFDFCIIVIAVIT